MQQWEYKIVKVDASDGAFSMYRQASYKEFRSTAGGRWENGGANGEVATIDALGVDGWEMVSIDPRQGAYDYETMAVFKRPKQEQEVE